MVVYPNIGARDRTAMVCALLMLAEGRIERETAQAEVPNTHLICRGLTDCGYILRQLSVPDRDSAWAEAPLGRTDDMQRPDPGSARGTGLPASRDFQ